MSFKTCQPESKKVKVMFKKIVKREIDSLNVLFQPRLPFKLVFLVG